MIGEFGPSQLAGLWKPFYENLMSQVVSQAASWLWGLFLATGGLLSILNIFGSYAADSHIDSRATADPIVGELPTIIEEATAEQTSPTHADIENSH